MKNILLNKVFQGLTLLTTLIVSIIAVLTFKGKDKKEISFIIESAEKVVDLKNVPSIQDLSISIGDTKIKELYFLKAKIKNTGNQAIELKDFYEEKISLTVQDTTTKFVSFDLDLEPSFRSCQFSTSPYFIALQPALLNPEDYISIYITFTQDGKIKLPLFETSVINGTTNLIDHSGL